MSEDTVAPATQDAPVAQEPSNSVTEVNQTDTPQIEAEPETPEAAKERLAKQQAHFEKRDSRQRKALQEQQRQLQDAQKRIREYEEKLTAAKPVDDKPNPDNFDDTETYADALAEWKITQKEKAKEEELKQPDLDKVTNQKAEIKLKEIDFKQKEADFIKVNPNYDSNAQVVNQFLGLANKSDPRFQTFSTVLLNSENPPALINYLGENPKEIMTLFNAPTPLDVEFALEGMLEKIGAPKNAGEVENTEPAPKALPTPPTAIKTGSTKVVKSVDDMSGKELLAKFMPKGR